jgi:hypothetical protein
MPIWVLATAGYLVVRRCLAASEKEDVLTEYT